MGQAKKRGTFEERLALALEREARLLNQQNLALSKPLNQVETRKSTLDGALVMAALADSLDISRAMRNQ